MSSDAHISHRLLARLEGTLAPAERDAVDAHVQTCSECAREREVLEEARALLTPLPSVDPRAGFAYRVALAARDQRHARPFALPGLRWAFGGTLAAGMAAMALFLALRPQRAPGGEGQDPLLARLEMYEDMSVLQNQEALENLEVVSVLHTLDESAAPAGRQP